MLTSLLAFVAAPAAPVIALPAVIILVGSLAAVWLGLQVANGIVVVVGGALQAVADAVPFIGGYLSSGIGVVVDAFGQFLQTWLTGAELLLGAWWDGVGIAIDAMVDGAAWLGQATLEALDALRNVTLPDLLGAVLAPLQDGLAQLGVQVAALGSALWERVAGLEAAVLELGSALWERVAGLEGALADLAQTVSSELLTPVRWLTTTAIPAIEAGLGELADGLGKLRDELADLKGQLAGVLPWLIAVAGAVAASQAIEGIRTATRSKPKLDRMCQLDLDEVDDLLELALLLPSLALIVAAVDEAAEATGDLVDEMGPSLS